MSFCCLIASCTTRLDVGRADAPVEFAVAPIGPATGITPCLGWPGGINGEAVYSRHNNGTVDFHGGTWTVPIAAPPGRQLSGVTFTVQAPTGHNGDPDTIVVDLYSSATQTILGEVQLAPGGVGVQVPSSIALSPARAIAAGETLGLIFTPLRLGDYAASDTRIVSVGAALAATPLVLPFSSFSGSNVFSYGGPNNMLNWSGPWSVYATVPVPDGMAIASATATVLDAGGVQLTLSLGAVCGANPTTPQIISSSAPSSGARQPQILTITSQLPSSPDCGYFLQVARSTGGTAATGVYLARVDYNSPN